MSRLSRSELANLIGELHAGRNPAWYEQLPFADKPPVTASAGISLSNGNDGGAITTMVQVRVRRVAAYRTAVFTITEDDTQTYELQIDAGTGTRTVNDVSDASATKQEIADMLKAAIEADAGHLADNLLAYSEQDPDSGEYRLRITGKPGSDLDADDFDIIAFTATGAGDLECEADPSYAEVAIWGLPGGSLGSANPSVSPTDSNQYQPFVGGAGGSEETSPWLQPYLITEPSSIPTGILEGLKYVHFGGYVDRLNTAGLARLALQVQEIGSPSADHADVEHWDPRLFIAPCRRESETPSGIPA